MCYGLDVLVEHLKKITLSIKPKVGIQISVTSSNQTKWC